MHHEGYGEVWEASEEQQCQTKQQFSRLFKREPTGAYKVWHDTNVDTDVETIVKLITDYTDAAQPDSCVRETLAPGYHSLRFRGQAGGVCHMKTALNQSFYSRGLIDEYHFVKNIYIW